MIKEELYHKTVNILVEAYFNDTLEHDSCYACAVGNMVAANCNLSFEQFKQNDKVYWVWAGSKVPVWDDLFKTDSNGVQHIDPRCFNLETKKQVMSTGYNWHDLAKIEYAFETANKGTSTDEYMFNGLMAVTDVLDEIHENKDTALTTTTKNKFSKQPA